MYAFRRSGEMFPRNMGKKFCAVEGRMIIALALCIFVFKRENIMEKIWGSDVVVGDRTIDVHIRKLREKIGDRFFKTVKGVGYKFIQPEK